MTVSNTAMNLPTNLMLLIPYYFQTLMTISTLYGHHIFIIKPLPAIHLTWEQEAYTFYEGINDMQVSSTEGTSPPPTIIKQNGTITELELEIYTQVYTIEL